MNIQYTHEMFVKTKKLYTKDVLGQRNVINREFEHIDDVSLVTLDKGIQFVQVEGTLHLYGFQVENGGFYDVINGVYYPQTCLYYINGTVKSNQNELTM